MPEILPEPKTIDPLELLREVQHNADLAVHHASNAARAAQELTRLGALKIVGTLCRECGRYPAENGGKLCFGCSAYQEALAAQADEARDMKEEMKNHNNGDGL